MLLWTQLLTPTHQDRDGATAIFGRRRWRVRHWETKIWGQKKAAGAQHLKKKDDVYEHADDDDDVVGSDDNGDEDDHDVDERNLQGWPWLPSQITWRNWTDREETPIS